MLNDMGLAYANASAGWLQILLPIAQNLFLFLATLELAWSGIWWALAKRHEDVILIPILRRVVQLMFFYSLLLLAPQWIPTIIGSFAHAGQLASGFGSLDPDSVLQQGISIQIAMYSKVALVLAVGPPAMLVHIPALLFVLSFAVIAGTLLVTLIESFLVIGGGVLLLGFAASRWTITFAEGYLLYAVRVGVKLFVIYLLIGVGMTLPQQWLAELNFLTVFDLRLHWLLTCNAIIFMMIVLRIPNLAADMVGPRATFQMDRIYQDS
jgi:type IV secretion system protein TrbL